MTDIKLFHKILIIIALVLGLSKLSKTNFLMNFIQSKCRSEPKQIVKPVEKRPVQREYTSVPLVEQPRPRMIQARPVMPTSCRPSTLSCSPPISRAAEPARASVPVRTSVSMESTPSCNSITIDDSGSSSPEINTIHIDDGTFNRFY